MRAAQLGGTRSSADQRTHHVKQTTKPLAVQLARMRNVISFGKCGVSENRVIRCYGVSLSPRLTEEKLKSPAPYSKLSSLRTDLFLTRERVG